MGTVIGKEREIQRLYRKKFSVSSIARKLGVATTAISEKLERMGLRERIHPSRLSEKEKAAIVSEYTAGATSGFLAKKYNVATVTIRDTVRKGGGQLVNRGQRPRVFTGADMIQAKALWEAKIPKLEIAKALNTNVVAASRLLLSMGIVPVNRHAKGARHGNWIGGRREQGGYIQIRLSLDSPYASMVNSVGYVAEHRLVMAQKLGRPLRDNEEVHHINQIKTDNRIENLQLRQLNHGDGTVYRCRSCGSHDVEPVELQ
jgi:transposase-like protein